MQWLIHQRWRTAHKCRRDYLSTKGNQSNHKNCNQSFIAKRMVIVSRFFANHDEKYSHKNIMFFSFIKYIFVITSFFYYRPLLPHVNWRLWTTEKEINFFIDWNLCNQITQTLNNGILLNNIPFKKGGSFGVKGKLSTVSSETFNDDSNDLRTDFEFESATLDLDKWGTYTFPPVGKGWFDTIYLDDSFRVDVNSRNDILICKS